MSKIQRENQNTTYDTEPTFNGRVNECTIFNIFFIKFDFFLLLKHFANVNQDNVASKWRIKRETVFFDRIHCLGPSKFNSEVF